MQFRLSPTTETNLKSMIAFAGILTLTGFIGSFAAGAMGIYVSLALTTTFTMATMWYCRELVTWLMGAKEVKPGEKTEGFDLHAMVDALYKHPKINLSTKPKVCVIESDKKNAFATGRHKNHTAIAITTGLLKEALAKANGDQEKANRWIEAIWCHELGHIVHSDIATKSTMSLIASTLRILSEAIYDQRRKREAEQKSKSDSSSKSESESISLSQKIAEFFLFYWIIPFTGTLLSLCLSRAREFAADDMARQCGRGEDLAQAFENLLKTPSYQGQKTATHSCNHLDALSNMMCLSLDPATDKAHADALNDKNIGWLSWTYAQYKSWAATHPPIEDRIKRLREHQDTTNQAQPAKP